MIHNENDQPKGPPARTHRAFAKAIVPASALWALLFAFTPVEAQKTTPGRPDILSRGRRLTTVEHVAPARFAAIIQAYREWRLSNAALARHTELRSVRGLSPKRILAYADCKDKLPSFRAVWDESGTVPILLAAKPLWKEKSTVTRTVHSPRATGVEFLRQFSDLLGLAPPIDEFRLASSLQEEDGTTHARYAQFHEGIPVWSAGVILHIMPDGLPSLFMGRYHAVFSEGFPTAEIDGPRAIEMACAASGVAPASLSGSDTASIPTVRLVWYASSPREQVRLCYEIVLQPSLLVRRTCLIDAKSGFPHLCYDALCSDGPSKTQAVDLLGAVRTIDTYQFHGMYYLLDGSRSMFDSASSILPYSPVGAILTLDARNGEPADLGFVTSPDNTWADRAAVSAHANTGLVYEYFHTVHGRESLDDRGGNIVSVVNASAVGVPPGHAFWNGRFIVYGNGGKRPSAAALDIAAHEFAHGVVEHSANLLYLHESGALHESFCDIFAAMVDRDDWLIGEDLLPDTAVFPHGAYRDLSDPHNGAVTGSPAWQPAHTREYVHLPASQDNGGVHVNSGIPNHAAYLLSEAVGRDKAERILYRALTTKLTALSRFVDFRLALTESARELFGDPSAEALACADACDRVGIPDGQPTPPPRILPAVDGPDRMLFLSTDPTDPVFLWSVAPPANPNDFYSITNTPVISRPSVTDDGSTALFVDMEGKLRAVSLDPFAPNETVLDSVVVWNTTAISRDGTLAALTAFTDEPFIHVVDLTGNAGWKTFDISAPILAAEQTTSRALLADALEFSPDGSSLLFDAYSEITLEDSLFHSRDILRIDVWDATRSRFDTGSIFRVVPADPKHDLSNPTYAKNHQALIAFDAYDPLKRKCSIVIADLLTGARRIVAELPFGNEGVPSFRGDDRALSFSAPSLFETPGVDSVYIIPLGLDAMTPEGRPVAFLAYAMLPVWYRTGTRPAAVETRSLPPVSTLAPPYPNPARGRETTIPFTVSVTGPLRIAVHDALGREIRVLTEGMYTPGTYAVTWDAANAAGDPCAPGVYHVVCRGGETVQTRPIVLLR